MKSMNKNQMKQLEEELGFEVCSLTVRRELTGEDKEYLEYTLKHMCHILPARKEQDLSQKQHKYLCVIDQISAQENAYKTAFNGYPFATFTPCSREFAEERCKLYKLYKAKKLVGLPNVFRSHLRKYAEVICGDKNEQR